MTNSATGAAAFAAIRASEASNTSAIADSVSPPVPPQPNQTTPPGWTVGWDQEDFGGANSATASQTLIHALVASGQYNTSQAAAIATSFSQAGEDLNIAPYFNANGVSTANGVTAVLSAINSALQTSAGAASILASSTAVFSNNLNSLISNIQQDDNVLPAVQNALTDPTYGPLMQIVLGDINNQFSINPNSNSPTGVMGLLTNGSTPTNSSGNTTTLNTTSAATIVQSLMSYDLATKYGDNGGASDVCRRLANDVTADDNLLSSEGLALLPGMKITADDGTCNLTPSPNGTTFTGTWSWATGSLTDSGSFSGTASDSGSSGSGTQMADSDTSTQNSTSSSGAVDGTVTTQVASNGTTTATDTGDSPPETVTDGTITVASGADATDDGYGDTIDMSGAGTVNVTGYVDVQLNVNSDDVLDAGFGLPGGQYPGSDLTVEGLNFGLSWAVQASNVTATYTGSGQNVEIAGTNATATGISGGNVQVNGSSQGIVSGTKVVSYVYAGGGLTVSGLSDRTIVTGSNATVTQKNGGEVDVRAYNTGVVINGSGLTIYEGAYAKITVNGGGNNVIQLAPGQSPPNPVQGPPAGPTPTAIISTESSTTQTASPSATQSAATVFAPGSADNTISYDASGYGAYGGYGFSEAPSISGSSTSGTNIGLIASYDAHLGDQGDAQTALSAKMQAQSTLSTSVPLGRYTPEFEGAKWATKTITWSLASTYDPIGAQLSGLIASQYAPLISHAFQDWSVLTGLKFQQVSASASPDIELGWSSFNPKVTGILGYTGFGVINGAIQAGALISLENPAEDALVKDSSGQLAYSGTQTELQQLLLHQIGQALGLADNADPKSIMYAVLSSKNRFFDATDLAGIQDLYDHAPAATSPQTLVASNTTSLSSTSPITVAASLVDSLTPSAFTPFSSEADQLINAMAVFNPTASPTTFTPITLASVASSMTLAASIG